MGGLRTSADVALADLDPDGASLLLLVGSDGWAAGTYPADVVLSLLQRYLDASVLIGAICGATVALARGGFFSDRAHTSNDPRWLEAVATGYAGRDRYDVSRLVVVDAGIVTAPGSASTPFAAEILGRLGVLDETNRRVWTALYATGRFPEDADIAAFFASRS